MKNEFTLAFNEVLEEKQLPKEIILRALESAMVSAYRKAVNASNAQHVEARIDSETGRVVIYAEKEVVESVQDQRTEVSLEDARKVNPEAELGTMVIVESTPKDFGRVAAQTARQVIQQRIREAERQAQLTYYDKQLGEIASGVVQAVNAQGITIGLDMKAEGVMMRKEMIPGERFRVHDRLRALVYEVKDGPRGPQIMLSRAHRNFLRRLLENEVPEIYHGVVEIRSIAREPGERAKVAVAATQQGIDPVGACVGIRGVRIQAIVRELHDEKIDVIEWNADPAVYIAKAISPARVSGVFLNERASGGKTATVVVPEDQLSLAIGRDGQNARLAAKLTGWRIDIKSVPEAAVDTMNRLKTDPALAAIAQAEAGLISQVEAALTKKAEGRPLTPEEYDSLNQFVDRIERRSANKRQAEKKAEETRRQEARSGISQTAFRIPLQDSGLADFVGVILTEAGYESLGDLMVQLKLDSDAILGLQGIGPRSMQEIERLVDAFNREQAEKQAQAEAEAAADAVAAAPEEVEAKAETVEPVAAEETVEQPAEPEVEQPAEAKVTSVAEETAAPVAEESEEEMPATLDEIFALKPEVLDASAPTEEEEDSDSKTGKKGKHKKKHIEVVYDPDRDVTVVRKKHKRGGGEWGDWE
ncbi:MAG TPA: transcription termination factor NusA [Anaerolineaceae bacterium]|nr:transcription termination factor NusA [Anaerolineaceae bacterium]